MARGSGSTGSLVTWQYLPWVCRNLLQLNAASHCGSGVSGGLRPSAWGAGLR